MSTNHDHKALIELRTDDPANPEWHVVAAKGSGVELDVAELDLLCRLPAPERN